ncbi:MAG: hypothetical protein ACREX3_15260 [Gammaproteobacteria bacterium]
MLNGSMSLEVPRAAADVIRDHFAGDVKWAGQDSDASFDFRVSRFLDTIAVDCGDWCFTAPGDLDMRAQAAYVAGLLDAYFAEELSGYDD